jgi:hypothetical protein
VRPRSLGESLREIGELEAATLDDAREHAGAIIATVRESISDQEFGAVVPQLPSD